jgi:hypothetical protein
VVLSDEISLPRLPKRKLHLGMVICQTKKLSKTALSTLRVSYGQGLLARICFLFF